MAAKKMVRKWDEVVEEHWDMVTRTVVTSLDWKFRERERDRERADPDRWETDIGAYMIGAERWAFIDS